MRVALLLKVALVSLLSTANSNGPFSKFDDHEPDFRGYSSRNIYDIERCLLDMPGKLGPPVIYAQPDRPGVVTLLWIDKARAIRRIDLRHDGDGTNVTAWHPRERVVTCAGL